METDGSHSRTQLINQLRSSDQHEKQAAQLQLFQLYSEQLCAYAKSKLSIALIRRGHEPQALADTALRTFLMNPRPYVTDRNSLWVYLIQKIGSRCKDAIRREHRQKRSTSRENKGSDLSSALAFDQLRPQEPVKQAYHRKSPGEEMLPREADSVFDDSLLALLVYGATPDQGAIVNEMLEQLSPKLQEIAIHSLEGHSPSEISMKQDIGERTVRRALAEIRQRWNG